MAALQILPSLTTWHQRSVHLLQVNSAVAWKRKSEWGQRGRKILPDYYTHIGSRQLTRTQVKKADHSIDALGPSAYDRMLAAWMYIWPICEGSRRYVCILPALLWNPDHEIEELNL